MVLSALLGLLALWSSNASQSRNYPYHVASMWQCNDPYFLITYNRKENGALTSYEKLEWNDEAIQIDLCFLMSEYYVYPVTSSEYGDRLLSGTWEYRNGDLVLIIDEDYIFDNQYKELVFAPVK